jgi:hypothetical protein
MAVGRVVTQAIGLGLAFACCALLPSLTAAAAESETPPFDQAVCDLIAGDGRASSFAKSVCRWKNLPNRPLLTDEVVELSIQNFADERQRAALVDSQVLYFRRIQLGHLFVEESDFNLCPSDGKAGRKVRIFHRSHVEHFGYAQCGDRIVTLRVYLLKTGGTDPSAVFEDIASRAGANLTRGR